MPLQEFHCEDCGHTFSLVIEEDGEHRKHACPHCESDHVERVAEEVPHG